MSLAGYNAAVKVTGVSTSMTGEAMTLVSGTTYQITDSAKEIFDPDGSFTVYDGGVPIATAITFDYLFGQVTLAAAPGGAVTIDGSYLPNVTMTCAYEYTFSASNDLLDMTCFSLTDAHRKRFKGLKDVSISISNLEHTDTFGTDEIQDVLYGRRADCQVDVVAFANLVDTETFTLNGHVFEFDTLGNGGTGDTVIDVSGLTTATDIRDACITAINGTGLGFVATVVDADSLKVVNYQHGVSGNVTNSETVTDAGFAVTNFTGGDNENLKVVEFQMGSVTNVIRAFVKMASREISAAVDGRVEDSLEFTGAASGGQIFSIGT